MVGLLVFFKRQSGDVAPLELDAMATIGDLVRTAQKVCELPCPPAILLEGKVYSDAHASLVLADLGVCQESTVCEGEDPRAKRLDDLSKHHKLPLPKRASEMCTLLAGMYGEESLLLYLLYTYKVNVKVKNSNGWGPLHLAARKGLVEVARALIVTGGFDANERTTPLKYTPLHIAASWGKTDFVNALLVEWQADGGLAASDLNTPADSCEFYSRESNRQWAYGLWIRAEIGRGNMRSFFRVLRQRRFSEKQQ
eukprot:Hpha_TRINITY_DN14704_c0_g1::TRINITY_DN14704_c0_g1_i2::g.102761::m.102761